jgi:hypothetical protein
MDASAGWFRDEFSKIDFGDRRLNDRFLRTGTLLSEQPEAPINKACNSWADTKAAYRLFQNDKVSQKNILETHVANTLERARAFKTVLAIQDTSFLDFKTHPKTKGLGHIGKSYGVAHDTYGLLMHTTYALTPNGLPIGLLDQEIWARKDVVKSKKSRNNKLYKENSERPIEEKESFKWIKSLKTATSAASAESTSVIHIADREADIYEFFCEASRSDTSYIVRARHDRKVNKSTRRSQSGENLWDFISKEKPIGTTSVRVLAKPGQVERDAECDVSYSSFILTAPTQKTRSKDSYLENVSVTAIFVKERYPPIDCDAVEWVLLTNLPVAELKDALQIVIWYSYRWQIEVFHKILKSGCIVEDCRLSTADRLIRFVTLKSVIAWRMHWLTIISRQAPETPCTAVFSDSEWKSVCAFKAKDASIVQKPPTVRELVRMIAGLGGFLGRKGDGEPGPQALWRGWQRMTDIREAWEISNGRCG